MNQMSPHELTVEFHKRNGNISVIFLTKILNI